ncbi:MAG: hypothetical protein QOF01_4615 [Thermomicrobiales bacterium]|nr:hypothetical protein [Thermomicrobiales bacterium]
MERNRRAAVMTHRGDDWTQKGDRRYSRRDAILLGASGVLGLVGVAMARSVFVEFAAPTIVAALPLSAPTATPTAIDVTPRQLGTRILTEVPMTGEVRDAIAAEATRFAPFGAGTVVTVRASWRAPDGGYGAASEGRIDLAEDLFADDPWSPARRDVELPAIFARSAFVNLTPRNDNGTQLSALGDYLTTISWLRSGDGRDEALVVLNPYSYLGPGGRGEAERARARAAMDEPDGLFALATTTFLRFPEELVTVVEAMASEETPLMPAYQAQSVVVDSPPKSLAKHYLGAVADLLTALVPNPDHRGEGYVKTQLDRLIPRFSMTRFDLGLRVL